MMQSLLSAEVLLPSLKELLEKYPVWLAENGDKIDPADKERWIYMLLIALIYFKNWRKDVFAKDSLA